MKPSTQFVLVFLIVFGVIGGVVLSSFIPVKSYPVIVSGISQDSTKPSNSQYLLVNFTNPASGYWTVQLLYGSACGSIFHVGQSYIVDTNWAGGQRLPILDYANCEEV